jgi:hypothetical protein
MELFILFHGVIICIHVLLITFIRNFIVTENVRIKEKQADSDKALKDIRDFVNIAREYIEVVEERTNLRLDKRASELFRTQTKIISKLLENNGQQNE